MSIQHFYSFGSYYAIGSLTDFDLYVDHQLGLSLSIYQSIQFSLDCQISLIDFGNISKPLIFCTLHDNVGFKLRVKTFDDSCGVWVGFKEKCQKRELYKAAIWLILCIQWYFSTQCGIPLHSE